MADSRAPATTNVTALLERWRGGDRAAMDEASAIIYPELRRIANAYLRRERSSHTLQPTALVHEAFIRLTSAGQLAFESRRHFYALAAQIMRRILVDYARAFSAGKRGGGVAQLSIDGLGVADPQPAERFLVLHDALDRLASVDARKAQVIELRYFGGLSLEETGAVLGISTSTAQREQRLAEAWLTGALTT